MIESLNSKSLIVKIQNSRTVKFVILEMQYIKG